MLLGEVERIPLVRGRQRRFHRFDHRLPLALADAPLFVELERERHQLHPGAPRTDGRQERVRIGGDQEEGRVPGRLFQRLEQRILRPLVQRISRHDDGDFSPAAEGREGEALGQRAHLVDPDLLRRRILQIGPRQKPARDHLRLRHHPHHVGKIAARDRLAVPADAARPHLGIRRFAVGRQRKRPRQHLFAHARRPGEQVGVVDLFADQRAAQQTDGPVLANDLVPRHESAFLQGVEP